MQVKMTQERAGKCEALRESTEFRVTDPKIAVKSLDLEDSSSIFKPKTVIEVFNGTVENFPDRIALMIKPEGSSEYKGITFVEYQEKILKLAKVFIKLGLERHGSVAVFAGNCAEWVLSVYAAIFAG